MGGGDGGDKVKKEGFYQAGDGKESGLFLSVGPVFFLLFFPREKDEDESAGA